MYVLDVPEQSFKGERIKSKAIEVFHFWEEKMKMMMKYFIHKEIFRRIAWLNLAIEEEGDGSCPLLWKDSGSDYETFPSLK